MKKILITIVLITESTFLYSQSMNLNNNKIRIVDSTMGLGISPTSRLHVFGNGTASNLLNVTNDKDATKDSSVVVDAVGNVGIGKETPTAKLYVQDTTSAFGGSIPVAYIRAAKPNKIALGAVSISGFNEIHPDYNIGLYASSMGGTNNFAGYFNGGDVYINNNLGIGRLTPTYRLDVFGNGGTTDLMKVSNDINSTYDSTFVVKKVGNGGIGVSAPTSKLEVANGYNSHLGSEPLAYFKAATNDKIAVLGSAVTDLSETFPDYNIGLYGTAHGGTNNFAGYFNLGNVYIDNNLGIGRLVPTYRLDVFGNGWTDNLLKVSNDINSTYDSTFVVNKVGKVGIGTTTPAAKFHIDGNKISPNDLVYVTNDKDVLKDSTFIVNSRGFVAIGSNTAYHPLHVWGSGDRDNVYSEYSGSYSRAAIGGSALGSAGYGIMGTASTIGAKGGLFENTASGIALDLRADNGTALRIISGDVIVNSIRFHSILTTLTDSSTYALPTGYSWKGEIDVDSSGYSLFTAQIRCDADGTPYLEGVSWKRWSSITYVVVGSTDGYLNITDGGSGMAITNKLGYTIDVTLRFRRKQ